MGSQLPTRENLGPMPGISPNVGIAKPDLTAVGQGIADLGRGFQQLGAGINQAEEQARIRDEANKKAWQEAKRAEATSKLLQFHSDQVNALNEFQRTLDPSQAEGASSRFMQGFDTQAKALLDGVDPSIRADLGDKAFQLRESFNTDAQTAEYSGSKVYTESVINQGTDTLLTDLMRNGGDNYDEVFQQGMDLITGNTALNKTEQFQIIEKWRDKAATAWVTARAKVDPIGTINDLNAHLKLQPPPPPDQFTAVPNPAGQTEAGNIDLTMRPIADLGNGEWATVRSMSINVDGREVLIPTIGPDGKPLSNDEAVAQYEATGKHLGIFNNPTNATAYAIALHNQQDIFYKHLLQVADQIVAEQTAGGGKSTVSPEETRRQVVASYMGLKALGFQGTNEQVYLAHAIGVDAAVAILSSPGQKVSDVVAPTTIAKNNALLNNKTTDEVIGVTKGQTGQPPPSPLDNLSPDKVANLIDATQQNIDKQRVIDDRIAAKGRDEIEKAGYDLMANSGDPSKPQLTPEWVEANRDNFPPGTYDTFLKALNPGDGAIHTAPVELLRLDALVSSNPQKAIQDLREEFAAGVITRGAYDQLTGRAQDLINGVEKRPFIKQTRDTLAQMLGPPGKPGDSALLRHQEALTIYDRWAKSNPDATAEDANSFAYLLNKNEKSFVGAEVAKDLPIPKYLGNVIVDRNYISAPMLTQAQKDTAGAFRRGEIDATTAAEQARLIQKWFATYAEVGLATVK